MKRIATCLALTLVVALAIPGLMTAALADTGTRATHGQTIVATSGHVYLILTGGEGCILYALPVGGDALAQVDTAPQIDEGVAVGDVMYYLRQDGARYEIVALDDLGNRRTVAAFADGEIAHMLRYYDGALYSLVNGLLHKIAIEGDNNVSKVSDRLMNEYTISDGVVYYVSTEDTKEYTHASLLENSDTDQIEQAAGMLYAMLTDGSNDTLILAQGVDTLVAHGGYLYFHNLNDNYVMASSDEEWLEGLLYRLNLDTNDLTPVLTSYDWAFAPTDAGLMVYKSTGIEMGTLEGENFSAVYTPEAFTTMAVSGTDLYVFEHTENELTRVNLIDGTASVIYAGSVEFDPNAGTDGEEEPVDDPDTTTDDPVDEEGDTPDTGTDSGTGTGGETNEPVKKTVYRKGDSGSEVLAFQKRLVELGYLTYADGSFGNLTESAVRAFQHKAGLTADGAVGPATMSALYKSSAPHANTATDSTYLLPKSGSKYLTEADVRAIDSSMWSFARNEILARHGYEFNTKIYADYFGNKTWYTPGGFSWNKLSAAEMANIELIKSLEESIGGSDHSQYIFPNSATVRLTEDQVRAIDRDMLGYARNEILARHGYAFTTTKYKNYFAGKSWYKVGGFSWSDLSDIETDNVELIKYVEENP